MERSQLEYFVAIIEKGGFTAAADALGLSQPSLSNSIKALERELGAQLLHRLPRGVRMTAAGEVFAETARTIIAEFERARLEVRAAQEVVSGTVDVITLPGLILDPLAGMIGTFREQHPRGFVRVHPAEQIGQVYKAVACGEAELGISDVGGSNEHRLMSHLICQQELMALVPPAHPLSRATVVSLEELMETEVVTGPPGTLARGLLEVEARRFGRSFQPAVEVGPRASALYFVLAGAGVGLLPRPIAELGAAAGAVPVAISPSQSRSVYLIHRSAALSPAAAALYRIALSRRVATQSASA